MASFSFDVFSGDWIRALCSGAKLVLCPRDLLLEPDKLNPLMGKEEIDSAEFVPAVLKNLVQYLENTRQNLHLMKLLVVGSDILYVREFEQFRRVCGEKTRLINSYGVTEATIDSTYFESTTLELSSEGLIPIGRPFRMETFVAPRTPSEAAIAKIMASVLGLEQVGIYDNFFELGGHSLLTTQVISRLRQTFNVEFPLHRLLENPTVAGLAKTLENLFDNSHQGQDISVPMRIIVSNCLVPIQIEGTQPPLFCIHPAGGQVMAYQNLANCLTGDRPLYGLQSRAIDDPYQEHDSIESMAIEYTKAIRQQQANEPYYLLGWSMGGVLALSIAKQLEQQQQKVAFIGLVDAFLLGENSLSLKGEDSLREFLPILGADFIKAWMNLDSRERQVLQNSLVNLSSGDCLKKVLAWGQQRNILSHHLSFDILQKQLALTQIHKKQLSNHYAPKIQTKLHIWRAIDRLGLNIAHTNWEEYTTGESYTKAFFCNHFSIVNLPDVKMLAQDLQACLEVVQSSGT